VVLFGEMLPEGEMEKAYALIERCSVLLIVGSSLSVYPAASFPAEAKRRGAVLVEVNSEPSEQTSLCDYRIFGQAGQILPGMAALALKRA
jgi:NAD-dependent deacetylase